MSSLPFCFAPPVTLRRLSPWLQAAISPSNADVRPASTLLSYRPEGHCLASSRQCILAQSRVSGGPISLSPGRAHPTESLLISNVTQLYSVQVARIETPHSTEEVATIIGACSGPIAIGGGRYSMGGQTAVRAGIHLDMRKMNKVIWLRPTDHAVRVQAGIRWRDLQDHLDPHGLVVKTMQSFSNFTVGGAVSVNCHGRYVGHGPIGSTVRALRLVLADGAVVEASPTARADLFRAAIAVITEVELDLNDNVRIQSSVEVVPLSLYFSHFHNTVLADKRDPAQRRPVAADIF